MRRFSSLKSAYLDASPQQSYEALTARKRLPTHPGRTGEPVALIDLHVGDELICATRHGLALLRVERLKWSNGELVAFFPEVASRIDPDKAIELKRSSRRTAI